MTISDSVEHGDKLVQTALDNFGRIGKRTNSYAQRTRSDFLS